MDYGITIAFVISVLVSAIFVAMACRKFFSLFVKKQDEFYVVKKKNSHIDDFNNELIELKEHPMEREMTKEEEFKKAA